MIWGDDPFLIVSSRPSIECSGGCLAPSIYSKDGKALKRGLDADCIALIFGDNHTIESMSLNAVEGLYIFKPNA